MTNFTVKIIENLCGKQAFYKLVNGTKCEFDEFWNKYSKDKLMSKQLAQIQARLRYIADLKYDHLDRTKYRELTGRKSNDPLKDYEIKTKNLRLYFFKDEIGQIIVFGGTKDSQDEDIKRMRAIKVEYLKRKRDV